MKKNRIIIFITIIIILLCFYNLFLIKSKEPSVQEKRAIFISYIEYKNYFKNKTKEQQIQNIKKIVQNVKNYGLNMIILHVVPFSDAVYKSKYLPSSQQIVSKEGDELPVDILECFIKESHQNNIELHAWINPYRVRNTSDITSLSKDNIAFKWLNEKSRNVFVDNGIYYNPASQEVLNLILNVVLEIINNYDIDGIHYDDYFYPNDKIDLVEYNKYHKLNPNISLKEFRYNNITKLIKETSKIIKSSKKKIQFGISPSGNIENNLNIEYLDIKNILKKDYLDYIMPQIYYGFENKNKPYIKTAIEWNNLIKNNNTKLIIALALYKVGREDTFALNGSQEWINENDILKRQVIIARSLDNYIGFSLFRYDNLFNSTMYTKNSTLEINNLFDAIKKKL